MNKSEYIIVANDPQDNLDLGTITIKGVSTCKYLGVTFNKQGTSCDEIKE